MRVASRYFKAPELLVDDKLYHYSMDMWSVGCTMAETIFMKSPFFRGADNNDQLVRIAEVMGTDDLKTYMNAYRLTMPAATKRLMREFKQVPLESFKDAQNASLCSLEAIDLLYRMLVYDKNKRITPADAMAHPYFDPVRAECIQS